MNIQTIKQDIDFLCGSTSASYPDAAKIRNVNISYGDISRTIWDSTSGWQYDDSNATTLPVGYAPLSHGIQDYTLPATTQRIYRVEIKDSSGNFQKLQQLNYGDVDVSMPEFYEARGMPIYYDLVGRSLLLYPSPASGSVTLLSGLAVYFDREVTEFNTTATTTVPGFATPFHRILSYSAALDFLQDASQRQFIANQKQRLEEGLVKFYSRRNVDYDPRVKPSAKKRWKMWT